MYKPINYVNQSTYELTFSTLSYHDILTLSFLDIIINIDIVFTLVPCYTCTHSLLEND